MGDEKSGGKNTGGGGGGRPAHAPKPPNTLKGMPQDMLDFLDCKTDKLELKPGKQPWFKDIPDIGGVLEDGEVKFEGQKDGSVKVTANLYGFDQSVKMSVDGDGQLSVDASDSAALSHFSDSINDWTKDFNDWLGSKGKKLGKPAVKDGKVAFAKENKTTSAVPQQPGVKSGFLPYVPMGEKVAAVGLFALATVGAIAAMPSDHTTTKPVTEAVAAVPTASSTAPPTGNAAPVSIADGCLGLMHVPGQYSVFKFYFTTSPHNDGPWMVHIEKSPTGPLQGAGSVREGHGEADVKIFQFGDYAGIQFNGPNGGAVPPGPFAPLFPYTVTSTPRTCDPSALKVPAASGKGQDVADAPLPAPTGTITHTETTTESGGAPISLLLIPSSGALLAGGLIFDNDRRRRRHRRRHHVFSGDTPVVPVEVETSVPPPELPPSDELLKPPNDYKPDVM